MEVVLAVEASMEAVLAVEASTAVAFMEASLAAGSAEEDFADGGLEDLALGPITVDIIFGPTITADTILTRTAITRNRRFASIGTDQLLLEGCLLRRQSSRTKSPPKISAKREYSGIGVETFDASGRWGSEVGLWRPERTRKTPPFPAFSRVS
jgi:hypothetical protein